MRKHNGYRVYILQCSDGTFYTGMTNNIDRRMEEHQQGVNEDSYTFKRRPVELKWAEKYKYVNVAHSVERRLKKWSAAKKRALIEERFRGLREYSKCHNSSSSENYHSQKTNTDLA